jgi:DNA-binding response OmpR family regulator
MSKLTAGIPLEVRPYARVGQCRVTDSMKILLIEDSRDLAANVVDFLDQLGCVTDYAANGLNGLHLAVTERYDAIILDLNLPGMEGLELLRRLRQESLNPTPVLILTARDTERDRLCGFDNGADDYVTKPFSLPELHARLKAIVRRTQGQAVSTLRAGDLEYDPRSMVARRAGRRLQVTPSGARILEKLMRAAPALVPRADLEHLLWGEHPPDSEAALRGHIHALRNEIDRGEAHRLLHTVHGIGYRLAVEDA